MRLWPRQNCMVTISSAQPKMKIDAFFITGLGTFVLNGFLPPLQIIRNAVGNASKWLFVTGFVTVPKLERNHMK